MAGVQGGTVWSRRLVGVAVVGLLTAAAVLVGLRDREHPALGVDTMVETAWLSDPRHGRLVLVDARSARVVTAVSVGEAPNGIETTQVGSSAVAIEPQEAQAVSGWTWQASSFELPGADTFVVADPSAAWLVSPKSEQAIRVEPGVVPLVRERVVVGGGLEPHQVRATDDGTLWVLNARVLRGLRRDGPPVEVSLGTFDAYRALTVVDGDPMVIDADRVRRIHAGSGAIVGEWPVDLAGGVIVAAERSERFVVARVGRRLVVAGPGRPTASLEIDAEGDALPIAHDGLVYLAGPGEAIVVIDPDRPPGRHVVGRIAVGGSGPIRLFRHHRRVWWLQEGASGERRAGVIDSGLSTRSVDLRGPVDAASKDGSLLAGGTPAGGGDSAATHLRVVSMPGIGGALAPGHSSGAWLAMAMNRTERKANAGVTEPVRGRGRVPPAAASRSGRVPTRVAPSTEQNVPNHQLCASPGIRLPRRPANA